MGKCYEYVGCNNNNNKGNSASKRLPDIKNKLLLHGKGEYQRQIRINLNSIFRNAVWVGCLNGF